MPKFDMNAETRGLPECLNCGHPVSVKGDPRHGGDDVPNHHFWTEDVTCHPHDLANKGITYSKPGQHRARIRHRAGDSSPNGMPPGDEDMTDLNVMRRKLHE